MGIKRYPRRLERICWPGKVSADECYLRLGDDAPCTRHRLSRPKCACRAFEERLCADEVAELRHGNTSKCERRRIVPQEVRYRGIELEDEYVLGYGLHAHDLYRNLPFVAAGNRADVADQADCYVSALYNGAKDAREPGGSVPM